MTTRVRFERTLYPHWGKRSGYAQFIRHLDPRRFAVDLQGTPDSDENDQLPTWLEPFKSWLRHSIACGMPWYKLVDLEAELAAMDRCSAGDVEIIHFLDGEHSGQFLPRAIKRSRSSAVRTVVTFHQPPDWETSIINAN